MFVNDLPFLTTFSRDFIFGMSEHVPYQTAKQFANSLMKVVKLYTKGGFVVPIVLTWHVDYLNISHKNSLEVTKFLHQFETFYGECMTVHRGKLHDYLSMDLDFSTANELKIGMIKYIKKIHKDFPEDIKSSAARPASEHLFDVREDKQDRLLPEEKARAFQHSTYQLLFLYACARLYICTSVSFLCTICKTRNEEKWGKLERVLKYLYGK